MSRYSFRQGIARHQSDTAGNPTWLQVVGQYVKLIVSPDPTIFIAAQSTEDYSFIENQTVEQAWGPFTDNTKTYYLYWDISLLTGELTRSYTLYPQLVQSTAPISPAIDQHWFDTTNTVMKYWSGSGWVEVVRVFAAELSNAAVLTPYPVGTQVGINTSVNAGYILYDINSKPLKLFQRNMRGIFYTTETPFHSQFSRLANFKIEATIIQAEATESIPIHYAVGYTGYNEISLASYDTPDVPAIGIAMEDMINGEVRSFITKGYVQDDVNWNWTDSAGTPIFVGLTGVLTTDPPQFNSIQRIATVVDPYTIFVDTKQIIKYS